MKKQVVTKGVSGCTKHMKAGLEPRKGLGPNPKVGTQGEVGVEAPCSVSVSTPAAHEQQPARYECRRKSGHDHRVKTRVGE